LEKRLQAARNVFEQHLARLKAGQGLPSELFGWSEHWVDAEIALSGKAAERAEALKGHLARIREVERMAVAYAKAGQGRQADADAAIYYRLEAEIRLLREGIPLPAPREEKKQTEKK